MRRNAGMVIALCLIIGYPLLTLATIRAIETHEGWQLTNIATGKVSTGTLTDPWTYEDCVAAAKTSGPGPYVYTVDPEWPIAGKCPAQLNGLNDPHLCFSPPNPAIKAAP